MSGSPKRNGHATVIGRLVEAALELPPGGSSPTTTFLTSEDEQLLRDCDDRQLAAKGAAIARDGDAAEWRALLTLYFRGRYDMNVEFDAPRTRIR